MRVLASMGVLVAGVLFAAVPVAGEQAAAPATTFLLVDKNGDGSIHARRRFKPIADQVALALKAKGYQPVAKDDGADIVIDIAYSTETSESGQGANSAINAAGNYAEETSIALTVQVFDPLRDGKVFDVTVRRKTMGLPRALLPAMAKEALQGLPAAAE